MVTNIRLAGVGGQGILVASELLCDVLLESGFDVKKSEIHGMAQRGGTVNSDVRFGEKVYSPIIPSGEVDILLAFERMEYPADIEDHVKARTDRLVGIDALSLAREAGSVRGVNVCLLGVLSAFMEIGEPVWESAITERFTNKGLEANLRAFALGREAAGKP